MVVIAVQAENRSEGRVDTLVFRNALLKFWMFGQFLFKIIVIMDVQQIRLHIVETGDEHVAAELGERP